MTNTQIDLKINDLKLNGKYWLFERALKDVTLELRIDMDEIDNRLPYIVYGSRQIDMTRERLRYLLAELALNRMELMDRDFDEVVSNFLGLYRKEIKMKRFEELAKATNEYRNYLMTFNEKAGERIVSSVDITTVCEPSIFVDGAFREIIKNSDQVEKGYFESGNIMYWVTVEGIKFWFIEGGQIMSWEERVTE